MKRFKGHMLRLFLDRKLEVAFTQLRADKTLGQSFAGLLCVVEGLHTMGYISEVKYQTYRKRYSVSLTQDPSQTLLEESIQVAERQKERKLFAQLVEQFDLHKDKPGWVESWQRKAMVAKDIPEAKRLLALILEQKK